jgi:hypothetical protein
MKIASFDIGIYNLAFAHLQTPELQTVAHTITTDATTLSQEDPKDLSVQTKIVDWGILCLKEKTDAHDFNLLSKTLVRVLYEKFADEEFDVVLIENQPCMKNPVMKSIQMIVYSFFLMKSYQESRDIDIKLVSASNKLKVKHKGDISQVKTKSKYMQNKQYVVAHVMKYLELSKEINEEWIDKFKKEKKKDDWSDAYAQALHYIENNCKKIK